MRLLIILTALFAVSCSTAKRCAEKFPVIEHTEKEIIRDTVTLKADTLKVPCPDGTVVEVAAPRTIVLTETVTVTKQVESMAKLEAFKKEVVKRERVEKHKYDKMVSDYEKKLKIGHEQLRYLNRENDKLESKVKDARRLSLLMGIVLLIAFAPKILSWLKIFV